MMRPTSQREGSHGSPSGEQLSGCVPLPCEFFARGSEEVAAQLVGKIIWREDRGGGRITEVEAYLPVGDGASHAAAGRTRRNAAMFMAAGHVYVFLCYGVHQLLNVVCDQEGVGSAVLIRSYEPLAYVGGDGGGAGAIGPGVVGRQLGVTLGMSGKELGAQSGLFILDDGAKPKVRSVERIGISRSAELPLRYYMVGSRYVSGPARMIERC